MKKSHIQNFIFKQIAHLSIKDSGSKIFFRILRFPALFPLTFLWNSCKLEFVVKQYDFTSIR